LNEGIQRQSNGIRLSGQVEGDAQLFGERLLQQTVDPIVYNLYLIAL
jgi:hypothetical protein